MVEILTAILLSGFGIVALAEKPGDASGSNLQKQCVQDLMSIPGDVSNEDITKLCAKAKQIAGCQSHQGRPIYYFDHVAKPSVNNKKILALSLIHGDEGPSGTVARSWVLRLQNIETRNSWRVIPLANPDGYLLKTRTNANGVDLNRNFPTVDWEQVALKKWQNEKDPRRYPGPKAASEVETQCLMKLMEDFNPDFIISIHTPYGVLDFDGPKISSPKAPLPWVALGNFPGSLGRYMWKDSNVPVLTIELKGQQGTLKLEEFDKLQDISGTVAIKADEVVKKKKRKSDRAASL